ncbi:hypothetical protein T4C_4914 [Trichinella pseudospiralis]|uniref:Uncharacterized protein n=1 Tax=Trichinella pseudospiralis TaxID=6337 RepID=A0A0V1ISM9_TRIPS|nr:hypothetical protein T4C_4914 [Trichinella pseudospiralis]
MAPDLPIPDPINSEEFTAVSSTKPVHRWKKETVPGGIQNDCISIQHLLATKLDYTGQPENYVVLLTKNCRWPINVATILLEENCNKTSEMNQNGIRGRKPWLRENASIFVDRKQHRLCQNASKVVATEQLLAGRNAGAVARKKLYGN